MIDIFLYPVEASNDVVLTDPTRPAVAVNTGWFRRRKKVVVPPKAKRVVLTPITGVADATLPALVAKAVGTTLTPLAITGEVTLTLPRAKVAGDGLKLRPIRGIARAKTAGVSIEASGVQVLAGQTRLRTRRTTMAAEGIVSRPMAELLRDDEDLLLIEAA